jgi:hypothetical protein
VTSQTRPHPVCISRCGCGVCGCVGAGSRNVGPGLWLTCGLQVPKGADYGRCACTNRSWLILLP